MAIAMCLGGVLAGLTTLLLVPLDCGVLNAKRPGLSVISRGGDLDFFRDADEPVTPITFDVLECVANEFIAASAMMYESANSGPSVVSPIAMGSSAGPDTTKSVAKASSPVGEPPPKWAVRPLSEDVKFY